MKLQINDVSQKRKIINYIECSQRPFTSKKISHELDIPFSTVARVLRQLRAKNAVKEVGRDKGSNIYARRTEFSGAHKNRLKEKQERIRKTFDACTGKTQKEIAAITGIPVTSQKVYLDLLFASGSIEIVKRRGINPLFYEKKEWKYNGLRHDEAKRIRREKIKGDIGVRYDRV
jgi:Fe2+ or Zn2+ uptake regulation protein